MQCGRFREFLKMIFEKHGGFMNNCFICVDRNEWREPVPMH